VEPDPKTAFSRWGIYNPSNILRTAYIQETVLPETNGTDGMPRLMVCYVWRVAFGRYRPWRVPKSGHVTITKIESLHIVARIKIKWFQKFYLFDLPQRITRFSRKKNSFRTVRHYRYWLPSYHCCWLVKFLCLFNFVFLFILFIVYHLWWNKDVYRP